MHVKRDYCGHVSESGASRFKKHIVGLIKKPNDIKMKFTNMVYCEKNAEEAIKVVRVYMEAKTMETKVKTIGLM